MPRADNVLDCTARLEQCHFPSKLEKHKNCALCYHTKPGEKSGEKQVMWQCEQCNITLHVPECFKKWHTHKKPPLVVPVWLSNKSSVLTCHCCSAGTLDGSEQMPTAYLFNQIVSRVGLGVQRILK
jgi:hypothetical protein